MATTFTLFPRLPCELRLQIWELALRPWLAKKGGINYVSAMYEDDAAAAAADDDADADTKPLIVTGGIKVKGKRVRFVCNRARNGGSSDPSHKSACLWDSGLLTACRESRDVIMRRYKKYQQSTQLSPWIDIGRPLYESPLIGHARDRDEDWHILFQQYKDIPCFTFPNWELLCKDEDYGYPLPFHHVFQFQCDEWFFALEFDASWMLNWPENDNDILKEASPRGYLARFLLNCLGPMDECCIWLIDRKATQWETSESLDTPRRIFYDMDLDYVVPEDVSNEVSEFLYKLGDIAIDWRDWGDPNDSPGYVGSPVSGIDDFVKVLVPVHGK